jgi:hypothetical protein
LLDEADPTPDGVSWDNDFSPHYFVKRRLILNRISRVRRPACPVSEARTFPAHDEVGT